MRTVCEVEQGARSAGKGKFSSGRKLPTHKENRSKACPCAQKGDPHFHETAPAVRCKLERRREIVRRVEAQENGEDDVDKGEDDEDEEDGHEQRSGQNALRGGGGSMPHLCTGHHHTRTLCPLKLTRATCSAGPSRRSPTDPAPLILRAWPADLPLYVRGVAGRDEPEPPADRSADDSVASPAPVASGSSDEVAMTAAAPRRGLLGGGEGVWLRAGILTRGCEGCVVGQGVQPRCYALCSSPRLPRCGLIYLAPVQSDRHGELESVLQDDVVDRRSPRGRDRE